MLSGVGPAEKDKCHVMLLMCGILKTMMQVHITLQEVKCDLGEFLTHQNTSFCKFYKNTVPCEHIASAFSEVRQRPVRMMDPEA